MIERAATALLMALAILALAFTIIGGFYLLIIKYPGIGYLIMGIVVFLVLWATVYFVIGDR